MKELDTKTNIVLSVPSTDPSTQQPSLELALKASMKRLLGVNDGYGSLDFREQILNDMNELCRDCEFTDGFLERITVSFRQLLEDSKKQSKRFTVMREAIIAEQAGLTAFLIRQINPG